MKIVKSNRKCVDCSRGNCFINKYCSNDWKSFFTENKTTYLVKSGEKIFSKGEEVKGAYTVYSGYIKVYDSDESSEKIVDLVAKGSLLGYRALGRNTKTYTVTAEALSECEVTFFSADILRLAVESNKELAFFIIDLLTEKLRKTEARIKSFGKITAKEKIICSINEVIETFGIEDTDNFLKFTPSRKDIANISTTTYETVIRTLSEFDKEKLIKIEGKKLRILNAEFFRETSEKLLTT